MLRRVPPTLLQICAATALLAAACGRPEPAVLSHEAYVWQRSWTGSVRESVARAPTRLSGLRVLILEIGAGGSTEAWTHIDPESLAAAARPVTAVVRIDGSRPIAELSLQPVLDRIAVWQRAGIEVVGVEIDHDCATAALTSYARWLQGARPARPLRWSITALPTWTESPALAEIAATVDELVVQVHAVRAPRLFDAAQARFWLETMASSAPGTPLRVALPTYTVTVAGRKLVSDPRAVAALVRDLQRNPIRGLAGVVWFRLPVAGDRAAWSAPTLNAVIAGEPLVADVVPRLVLRSAAYDIVIENHGSVDGRWPDVRIRGGQLVELVAGYRRGSSAWTAPNRVLRPGQRQVVGWATGEDVTVDAR